MLQRGPQQLTQVITRSINTQIYKLFRRSGEGGQGGMGVQIKDAKRVALPYSDDELLGVPVPL